MNGCEWVVEGYGCDARALADPAAMAALFDTLIQELGLHPVAPAVWHQFPHTGGITGMCMLSESHLACHTFPEYNLLCLNVFCCSPRPEWDFAAGLERALGARSVRIRRLDRPYQPDEHGCELPELRCTNPVPLV